MGQRSLSSSTGRKLADSSNQKAKAPAVSNETTAGAAMSCNHGRKTAYSIKYDATYHVDDKTWCEGVCDDDTCTYCWNRPAKYEKDHEDTEQHI